MEIHFQEEIIMDILTKLPVFSLLRYKCVSKFWKTLICDPYFKGKHLNYAKDDPDSQKLLICHIYPKERISSIYSCPLSPVQLPEDVQKLDCSLNARPFADCCCDGLVFLFASDGLNKQYMLWNPSTRESIVLPRPEFSLSCCMYRLAYDAASYDYKILKIDVTSVGPEVFNEILALKSGSWKRVGKPSFRVLPVSCGVPSGRDCLAFVHGTFH
ncbi:putative F-box protein [Capsicum annuum]